MSYSNITSRVKTSVPAVPQIYAYTTPEIRRHNGWTKIGYTEQDVVTRVKQQTHTADVRAVIEWHGNATWEDGSGTFRDTDFHGYLRKLDVENEPDTEWFQIEPQPAKTYFYEFRENHGIIGAANAPQPIPYQLRREQEEAVEAALAYSQAHERGEFLWNAKPRFGKTLASYELAKRLDARKVLVVTNRPAIANSWYSDYVKFLGPDSGYRFVSSVDGITGKPFCLTRQEYLQVLQKNREARMIEFVSLQDLKGSVRFGGVYDKLNEVADLEWDLLIIDEAHEGVDTYRTDIAFDQISRRFTLHLSGTPFKAIANEKFPEDAIYNWTYADEQEAKHNWANPDERNPYADLPVLNLFTYQMSDIIRDKAAQGVHIDDSDTTVDPAFDLNEFFSTKPAGASGTPVFIYNEDVNKFLDALTTQTKYPFSTPELRDELKHTLWMLNRVDSAKALARKLRKHPVFKDYEIVLAAGDGKLDDADETTKSFDKVVHAIATHDKTITLSVGQLTTGVTIPEWTGVLMLSTMKSPALYMQAAFRAQNPCLFTEEHGKFRRKENSYVFDFDPARTLTIVEEFANDLSPTTTHGGGTSDERKQNVRRLLNFLPVLGEDEDGQMTELDAEHVLSIPRRIHAHEVVRSGFMSDFLFQNIGVVFRAPSEVVDIIKQFTPAKEPATKEPLTITPETASELSLDEDGNVNPSDELVIGEAAEVFGPKQYESIGDKLDTVIQQQTTAGTPSEEDRELDALCDQFTTNITSALIDQAKTHYGEELKPAQQAKIERKVSANIANEVNRKAGNYKIRRNQINLEREKAIQEAQSESDVQRAETVAAQQLEEAKEAFKKDLSSSTRDSLIEQTGQTIVREIETAKREEKKESLESTIRDHLRGFSRTIPSFLMAYGDENTTLANFDKIIPPEVFEEVTSISVNQFRFLRDGGDYTDNNGETAHFDGHLFDSVVFDDSVKEFISLRSRLANYFDETQKEDIFDYVPPQHTNQIYTPRNIVVKMVDMFEQENPGCFDNPDHTFADLYMKSGLYITEIVKRLYNSETMRRLYPDSRARLDHIFACQVFGVAPSEIIYQIATHFILGYNGEVGDITRAHFTMADTAELAKEGKLADYVEATFGDCLQSTYPSLT